MAVLMACADRDLGACRSHHPRSHPCSLPRRYFLGLQAYEPSVTLYTLSGGSHAPSLTGSWVSKEVYPLPALPVNATMAYAAKSHPHLLAPTEDGSSSSSSSGGGSGGGGGGSSSESSSLIISYNTNGPADAMAWTTDVYHPIFVRLDRSPVNASAQHHVIGVSS